MALPSAKGKTLGKDLELTLGKMSVFAECLREYTRQSVGLCRVFFPWHSAKPFSSNLEMDALPSAMVKSLGKLFF